MRMLKVAGAVCIAVFVLFMLGCSGFGWVRVSPDKRYATIVVPVKERGSDYLELRVYDLQTRQTIPVFRIYNDINKQWFGACQWSPNSRKLVFYANKDKKESLYMFDIISRKLTRLPIKELGVAVWSHDGEYLLVSHTLLRSQRTRLIWYRTSDWTKAHSVVLPRETMTVDCAQSVPDVPFSAVVLLSDRNLYLVQGSTIQQLTTTGDVVAFRVFPKEKRLRWVRCDGFFLAVFERNLTTMAVKRLMRIDLSPSSGMILDCRFSPNGERLAWEEGAGIFVVTIPTQQIHCLISFPPSESKTVSAGFDWYGDDTLLILNNKLEILTFTIQQPSL